MPSWRACQHRRLVFAGLAVLLLATLVGSIIWLWPRWLVHQELQRIRAAGEPVTFADLARRYEQTSAEKNATDLWLEAIAVVSQIDDKEAEELPYVGRGDAPSIDGVWPELGPAREYIQSNAQAFQVIHRAAAEPILTRLPINFQGPDALFPPVTGIREISSLLQLELEVHIRDADHRRAIQAALSLAGPGRALGLHPGKTAFTIRVALDKRANDGMERLLSALELTTEELQQLYGQQPSPEYEQGLRRAILGSRVEEIPQFKDSSHLQGILQMQSSTMYRVVEEMFPEKYTNRRLSQIDVALWPLLWKEWDLATYLAIARECVAATRQPLPSALGERDRILGEYRKRLQPARPFLMTRYTAPSCLGLFDWTAEAIARDRSLRTAIAVERYHRHHCRLPDCLKALTPGLLLELPIDPFTGEPLCYVVREHEHLIYSVGSNRTDEGGNAEQQQDIVFHVRRAGLAPPARMNHEERSDRATNP